MSIIETIVASYDSFVNQSQPDANFGDVTYLRVRADTGENRRSYVYFPVDTRKMTDGVIVSATLRLYFKGTNASSTITAKRVTAKWREGNITFTGEPNSTDTNAASTTAGGANGEALEIDVTDIVGDWVSGKAVYGFRIITGATTLRTFFSSEAAKRLRPELEIEWVRPPEQPDELRPAGQRAITAAAPLLVWGKANDKGPGFDSALGGQTPSAVQVQIDNASDFATPIFDSGWVAQDQTEYDTALDGSPPALTDNTTYWWRVRIRDDIGTESDWSDVAEFQRRTKGVLTIVAPGATVEETTPTISHTFTGRTQESVYYELREDDEVVWQRKRTATTDVDLELPPEHILSETATYTIIVQVWDTFSRDGTDGEPFVEDSQDFTFVRSAGIDPVTDFVIVTADGHLLLTWSRAVTPDYFAIRQDGILLRDRIDPSEVALGGGDFELKLFNVRPRSTFTYEVEAVVVNAGVHEHSDTNPEVDAAFAPTGIWLTDPDTEMEVHIVGRGTVSSELGETGTTFFPLGRQDPVRLLDQVRGIEGDVSGDFVTVGDRTASNERFYFEQLKGDALATRRLVFAHRNVPVVIGESEIISSADPEEHYSVSFSYWQVDEFDVRAV